MSSIASVLRNLNITRLLQKGAINTLQRTTNVRVSLFLFCEAGDILRTEGTEGTLLSHPDLESITLFRCIVRNVL